MAQIPLYKRAALEDFSRTGEKVPSWFRPFFSIFNPPIEQVVFAFQRNITFSENHDSVVKTVTLENNVEKTISVKDLKRRPALVLIGYSDGKMVEGIAWKPTPDGNKINIRVKFEESVTDKVRTTIFVFGE